MQFPTLETAVNNWRTVFKDKILTNSNSMDVEIDTEKFIDEVKIRPILWNTNLDIYRDRPKTKEAWASIAAALAPEIEAEKDREELGRELQMKWRNLRDAFQRSERIVGSSKTRKTYRYSNQMAFLKNIRRSTTMPYLHRSDNSIKMDEVSVDDDQMKDDIVQIKNEDTSCSSDMLVASGHMEENFKEFPSVNVPTSTENLDDDMCFFQSLLPTVRTLDQRQKLSFRISVMTSLQQYQT